MDTHTYFYVRHLPDDWPKKSMAHKYTVELLNESCQAIAWAYFGDEETELRIGEVEIPNAVIEAARRQRLGKGDFVNEEGRQVLPKDIR